MCTLRSVHAAHTMILLQYYWDVFCIITFFPFSNNRKVSYMYLGIREYSCFCIFYMNYKNIRVSNIRPVTRRGLRVRERTQHFFKLHTPIFFHTMLRHHTSNNGSTCVMMILQCKFLSTSEYLQPMISAAGGDTVFDVHEGHGIISQS